MELVAVIYVQPNLDLNLLLINLVYLVVLIANLVQLMVEENVMIYNVILVTL